MEISPNQKKTTLYVAPRRVAIEEKNKYPYDIAVEPTMNVSESLWSLRSPPVARIPATPNRAPGQAPCCGAAPAFVSKLLVCRGDLAPCAPDAF
jgi:hypothetical protein